MGHCDLWPLLPLPPPHDGMLYCFRQNSHNLKPFWSDQFSRNQYLHNALHPSPSPSSKIFPSTTRRNPVAAKCLLPGPRHSVFTDLPVWVTSYGWHCMVCAFCVWLLSLSILKRMLVRTSCLFFDWRYYFLHTNRNVFVHLSTDGAFELLTVWVTMLGTWVYGSAVLQSGLKGRVWALVTNCTVINAVEPSLRPRPWAYFCVTLLNHHISRQVLLSF